MIPHLSDGPASSGARDSKSKGSPIVVATFAFSDSGVDDPRSMTLRLSVRRASGTWDPKSKGSPIFVATFAFSARDPGMAMAATRVTDLHLLPGI